MDEWINEYRIYRVNVRNITIQKKRGKEWRTISYHGHSANSLIAGLFELIIAQHTPVDEKLLDALENLQSELVSGIEEVERMVKEYCEK
jgi:hypothetical protein